MKSERSMSNCARVSLGVLLCLAIVLPAPADTFWLGTANNDWTNASNWDAGAPTSSVIAQFTTSGITSISHPSDARAKGLVFSGDAGFTINAGGGVLYVYDNGITVSGGSVNQVFNGQVRPQATAMPITNDSTGLLDFNNDMLVHLTSTGTCDVTFGGSGNIELKSIQRRNTVSEYVNLVKEGTGTLTIQSGTTTDATATGQGRINGTTTITGGTVKLGHGAALGSGQIILNGGTLETGNFTIANAIDVAAASTIFRGGYLQGAITGSGTVTRTGAGNSIILSGDNSGFGGTWIESDWRTFLSTADSGSALATWQVNSGKGLGAGYGADFSGTVKIGALTGSGVLDGGYNTSGAVTYEIGGNNASTTFSGSINQTWNHGTGATTVAIEKVGLGILTLSGANVYSGGTTLTSGTIAVSNSAGLGSGAVTMNGGTLNTSVNLANPIVLNDTANTIAPNGNYRQLSGQISGPGGFTVAGGGGTPGLELTNPANSFAGDVTINGGTYLRLTASEVLPDAVSVINNGNLRLDVAGGGVETIAGLSGGGSVWVPTTNSAMHTLVVGAADASSTFAGTIGASGQNNAYLRLTKIGAGTLTLTGNNPYTGPTTINGGTLELRSLGTGAYTYAGGALAINNGSTLRISTGGSGGGTQYWFNGKTFEFDSTGGGTVDTTSGLNFVVYGGSVFRTTGGAMDTIAGTSGINLHASNILTFDVAPGSSGDVDLLMTGPLWNAGGIIKNGGGVLALTGGNSYTGATTVNAGTLRIGNNTTSGSLSGSTAISVAGGAAAEWFRSDTSQQTIANAISGAGEVRLRGAGTTDGASQYLVSGNNTGFAGTWVLAGGRMNVGSTNSLGSAGVDVRANGQLLANGTYTASNPITITDSSGWRDGGFRLGAIRMEGNSNLSGNITLNQTGSVILGDNSGLNATISGYSLGNHVLSGVISGSGDFAMSRYTAWNGGSTQMVNIILQGELPNAYTGKTVVDGQGAKANLYLAKGTGALAGFAQTAGSAIPIPSGATITGLYGYLGGASIGSGTQKQAIQGDTFGGVYADGSVGWLGLYDGTYTKAVQVRLNVSGTTLTVTPLAAKYTNANWLSDLTQFDTDGTGTSIAVSDASGGYGVYNLKFAGALSSAYAIPANTVVQMGSATGGQANLRPVLDDQFAPGVVMNFVNASGQWMRFDLMGTSQTLAGLNAGTTATQAGAVIQNQDVHHTVPFGDATLTLNGSGTYVYHGYIRDADNGTTTRKLHLVKDGSGSQTLASGNINYTGATAVNGGTLEMFNTNNFRSATTVADGATLKLSNTGNVGIGSGATFVLADGATLVHNGLTNGSDYLTLAGAVTVSGNTTINQDSVTNTTAQNKNLFLDGGLKGSGTVTINAANAGNGVIFRNNNTTFAGTMIVNGIPSTAINAGSGIGVGGCTTGLTNADIVLNGTMEMLNQGVGWASSAPGDFWMGALSGSGVMVANFTSGGQTRVRIGNTGNDGDFSGTINNGVGNVIVLTKNGGGTQVLGGINAYTGSTTVNAGSLIVNGSIASSSGVSVAAGATLGGYGAVPGISGAGLVSPGASPGILTSPSVNPAGGLDFAFEYTDLSPEYGSPSDSDNDVLRLTGGAGAFASPLTSANEISLYFDRPWLAPGDVYTGGFFIEGFSGDLLANVAGATFTYYITGDGLGTHPFGGKDYYLLNDFSVDYGFEVGVAYLHGALEGEVLALTATVPEPATMGLLLLASAGIGGYVRRRRCPRN